ncbi:hypothetical protein ACFL6W_07375 [Thermodesulfobacteriota bacterium]
MSGNKIIQKLLDSKKRLVERLETPCIVKKVRKREVAVLWVFAALNPFQVTIFMSLLD